MVNSTGSKLFCGVTASIVKSRDTATQIPLIRGHSGTSMDSSHPWFAARSNHRLRSSGSLLANRVLITRHNPAAGEFPASKVSFNLLALSVMSRYLSRNRTSISSYTSTPSIPNYMPLAGGCVLPTGLVLDMTFVDIEKCVASSDPKYWQSYHGSAGGLCYANGCPGAARRWMWR
jgi:hypothetical protein